MALRKLKVIAPKVVLTVLVVAGMQCWSVVAEAQKVDYRRSINLADNQVMLMQKMSKEVLLAALGVDLERNLDQLETTQALFDRTLWGLRDGDPGLRLPVTQVPGILQYLTQVEDLWPPYDDAIRQGVRIGKVERKMVDALAKVEPPLFEAMNLATKAYVDEATKVQMHGFLAVAINLAGRQRMLSQKMTKEFLLIAYDYNVEANRARLAESIALFDQTLAGLINGDPERRLIRPPKPEITSQLFKVEGLWRDFLLAVDSAARGGKPSRPEIERVARLNLPLLQEMNLAVSLYEAL